MKKLKFFVTNLKFSNKKEGKQEKLKLDNAYLMYDICTIVIKKKAKIQALNYIENWFCLATENKKTLRLDI